MSFNNQWVTSFILMSNPVNSYSHLIYLLPPFPKDLLSFRLRVFPKDLPSFALFLIWQNKFPYLPSHVTIIWSTITLLIQFYSLSLSYFNPFIFVYLSQPLSLSYFTHTMPHTTWFSLVSVGTVSGKIFRKRREYTSNPNCSQK